MKSTPSMHHFLTWSSEGNWGRCLIYAQLRAKTINTRDGCNETFLSVERKSQRLQVHDRRSPQPAVGLLKYWSVILVRRSVCVCVWSAARRNACYAVVKPFMQLGRNLGAASTLPPPRSIVIARFGSAAMWYMAETAAACGRTSGVGRLEVRQHAS